MGIHAVAKHFNQKYSAKKYVFNRKTIESWTKKYKPTSTVQELRTPFSARAGRLNMVSANILLKIKEFVNSCRLAGCVINRSRVIAIGKGSYYTSHRCIFAKRMRWSNQTNKSLDKKIDGENELVAAQSNNIQASRCTCS